MGQGGPFSLFVKMDFDFKDLEIFWRIVELKSFTKAAERVYLSQASVSERISHLEEQVGLKLFDRLPKGVELTTAGRVFYGYAKKLLELRGELTKAVEDLKGLKAGTLEVGGSTVPGEYILPGKISGFLERYPLAKINLIISDSKLIREKVAAGLLELGVVGAMDSTPYLEFLPIWDDQLVLAVGKGHRLFGKEEVELEEILGEAFVLREEGSGTLSIWEKALEDSEIDPANDLNVVAILGSTTSVKEAIKSGLGVSVISKRAIASEIANGELWAINLKGVDLKRYFYLTWDTRRTLSPLGKEFKKYLLGFDKENNT